MFALHETLHEKPWMFLVFRLYPTTRCLWRFLASVLWCSSSSNHVGTTQTLDIDLAIVSSLFQVIGFSKTQKYVFLVVLIIVHSTDMSQTFYFLSVCKCQILRLVHFAHDQILMIHQRYVFLLSTSFTQSFFQKYDTFFTIFCYYLALCQLCITTSILISYVIMFSCNCNL